MIPRPGRYRDFAGGEYEVIGTARRFEGDDEVLFRALNEAGIPINEVRADLSHMLSSAMFNGIFEVVAHDLPREEAKHYVVQVEEFFNAGWDKLLGL